MKPWIDAEYHRYFRAQTDKIIARWRAEREAKKK